MCINIDISKTQIQSPEGQQFIREQHENIMTHLTGYVHLMKHLFTDKWKEEFLRTRLSKEGPLSSLLRPPFYLSQEEVNGVIWHKDYLKRADEAIDFISRKACKENQNDLFGNLQKCQSVAAAFEVMLAWALLNNFGEDNVELYPRINENSKETIDFAVKNNSSRVFIEAMVSSDDSETTCIKQHCLNNGCYPIPFSNVAEHHGVERFKRSCNDKIHQRNLNSPLILCVNQIAIFPFPNDGIEVVGNLLGQELLDSHSKLIGIAYFINLNLVSTGFIESRIKSLEVSDKLVSDVRFAFTKLRL